MLPRRDRHRDRGMRSRIRSRPLGIRSLERARANDRCARPDHRGVLPRFVKARPALEPVETNRTIARANHERLAAAIEFAANVGTTEGSRGGNRKVNRDLSIAGVRIQVGRKTFRKAQSDRTVASMDPPRTRHFRSRPRFGLDASVAGFKAQPLPAALGANAAIARLGFKIAIHRVGFDAAITSREVYFTFRILNGN